MKISVTSLIATTVLLVVSLGCSEVTVEELGEGDPIVIEEDPDADRITITDQTGHAWDVTHAVRVYRMKADEFQFGLGKDFIRPIHEPDFLSPGDPGYPKLADTDICVTARIGGEARAYKLIHLAKHEVVNDVFGDTHVTVGY